ncbi:putative RecA/RadA family phage recombinase [Agrobacterium vitis]|nr:putative RecA/RadA family phage recombinase [Agrobacterium vitis]MBE1437072.1 putative RecA/RadA family phage recombinase [Agrobacterium vitis]
MKNFKQPGSNITVPAPAGGTVSGKIVVIGSLVGIPASTQNAGEDVSIETGGVFEYAKTSALAISVGDKLYYDADADVLNKTDTNKLVGVAVSDAANPSPTVDVLLTLGAAVAA